MPDKKVDESWKNSVEQERKPSPSGESHSHAADPVEPESVESEFNYFVSSLAMQTLMALGELENPATGMREVHLEQAKYLIDTLKLLQKKTAGNLMQGEIAMLEQCLYDLQVKFVEKAQPPAHPPK